MTYAGYFSFESLGFTHQTPFIAHCLKPKLFLLQPPPPLVKTVWEERPLSRQGGKSGQSLASAMTKVGGTPKRNKTKSPARSRQNADVSASWTSPDSGLEVQKSCSYSVVCLQNRVVLSLE